MHGHHWFFDTYVHGHHYGHWVEGTAYLATALRRFHYQVQPRLPMIPDVANIVVPKIRTRLSDAEVLFLVSAIEPFNVTDVSVCVIRACAALGLRLLALTAVRKAHYR